jgi:hypothetical protein
MKDSFIVYKEWNALIRTLNESQRLKFYDFLFDFEDTIPQIKDDSHLKAVIDFVFLKVIDNDEKFKEKSNKSRESAYARWNKHRDKNDAIALIALQTDATTDVAMLNVNVNEHENVNEPVNKNVKKGVKFNFENIEWFKDPLVNKVFIDLLKNRVELKKAPTQRAIELMVKRARENFKTSKELIEAIENSIASGWPDIYPPKQTQNKVYQQKTYSRSDHGLHFK